MSPYCTGGTVNSVPGEDLERDVVITEPVVPCKFADSPEETQYIPRLKTCSRILNTT